MKISASGEQNHELAFDQDLRIVKALFHS